MNKPTRGERILESETSPICVTRTLHRHCLSDSPTTMLSSCALKPDLGEGAPQENRRYSAVTHAQAGNSSSVAISAESTGRIVAWQNANYLRTFLKLGWTLLRPLRNPWSTQGTPLGFLQSLKELVKLRQKAFNDGEMKNETFKCVMPNLNFSMIRLTTALTAWTLINTLLGKNNKPNNLSELSVNDNLVSVSNLWLRLWMTILLILGRR